jgi:hypothetical protein
VVDGNRVVRKLERPRGCVDIALLLAPWLR